MAEKTLTDLFHQTLKDIYYAERKIASALGKMARGAQDEKLKEAFLTHKEETQVQIERLQAIFELIDKRARWKTCSAIEGIIDEAEEIMEEFQSSPALDAGLIAAAQAVEHYEITRYGTLRTWAEQLGLNEAADLLEETLAEESRTDELLTKLAQTAVNIAAQKVA